MADEVPYPGWDGFPGMNEQRAIEWFMATNDGTAIDSWHWLIEWSTTSFYVKSLNRALQATKVSIHGPDPRHPGEEHFRFDLIRTPELEIDQRSAKRSARDGGRWLTDTSQLPHQFEGRQINDHVRLIVRFSTGPDTFLPGAPPAGGSDLPKEKATMKGVVPVPVKGRVRHIDVFLSDNGDPYWPDADKVRATRSGLGFIRNSLDWCLSAVVFDRPIDQEPDPCGDFRDEAAIDQCYRGMAATVDETGLLWLCEKLIPRDSSR